MEKKLFLRFSIVFLVLMGFSMLSLGYTGSNDMIKTVAAMRENNPTGSSFVVVEDELFDAKVLRFLKEERVCVLSNEQVIQIATLYPVENRQFTVEGAPVNVLYVYGNPINVNLLEQNLGPLTPEQCQVVNGNKVLALITPIFVS